MLNFYVNFENGIFNSPCVSSNFRTFYFYNDLDLAGDLDL